VSLTNEALIELAVREVSDALPAARAAVVRRAVVVREKARDVFRGAGTAATAFGADTGAWSLAGGRLDRHRPPGYHRKRCPQRPHRCVDGIGLNELYRRHYQEIALKGKNRPWFLGRLVRNIKGALSDLDIAAVRALMGRIEMQLGPARAVSRPASASGERSASRITRSRTRPSRHRHDRARDSRRSP
jgi:hypothetical protein